MGGSLASTRDIGGIPKKSAVILCSTRRRRPWVLACTRPKTCNQHEVRHENGSDRDDVEGGRELGWFHGRRRPFLTWGLHGQIQHRGGLWLALLMPYDRDFLHGGGSYDHIGWSAGRWGRYERAEVACLRQDRRSHSGVPSADNRNPIGLECWNGPRTCLGMGRTGGEALGRSSGERRSKFCQTIIFQQWLEESKTQSERGVRHSPENHCTNRSEFGAATWRRRC